MWARLKDWARRLRRDATALWLAARDPRVPFAVKALAALVAAYALSPIDLIPDFIPVLGFLDEVILLPIAIAGLSRLIDPTIMAEHRAAAETLAVRPVSFAGAAMIAVIWTLAAIALAAMLWKTFPN